MSETKWESDHTTPYDRGKKEWDDRMGSAILGKANWKYTAWVSMAMTAVVIAAYCYTGNSKEIRTFVITETPTGEIIHVSEANGEYSPKDAEIAWQLQQFTQNLRNKPTDPVVIKKNWQQAYCFVTQRGGQILSAKALEDNPGVNVGTDVRDIQVTSVLRQSEKTFQIRWQEKHYINTKALPPENWTALYTIERIPPKDESILACNPLGIYVDNLSWQQDFRATNGLPQSN